MSKFYTIPAYSGGALGGLMLGAARGEGDSYDRGWTGLLTGLGTTAGIGGSHYLTKQLENWDDILRSRSIEGKKLSQLIDANAVEASELNQTLKSKLERQSVLDDLLKNDKQLTEYAFENGDLAKRDKVNNILRAAAEAGTAPDPNKVNPAIADLFYDTESRIKNELTTVQNSINRLNNAIAETSAEGSKLTNKLTSIQKYLNKPMNRLAKKVPLITGLKWLSALALPAAGFAGAKSLGDYFSSKA